VLTVGTEESREYTNEDGELLQLFAQRAAQAIEAARSHEQAQRDAATKAVLLEEIHHRVRNNLSTVMTLLELERHRHPAPTLDESLARIRRRVQGLATVHTLLGDQEFDAVDFRHVAADLCRWASDDDASARVVEFGPRARPIELDAKRATALALALNELLTNALKHGVGKVRVSLRKRASMVHLCVRDGEEGPRRPVLTLPSDRPGGRGLRLVSTLVQRELHGTLHLEVGERGALAEVRFPERVASDGG
jgi:two-component system, sensor histidine kinase PdtaS